MKKSVTTCTRRTFLRRSAMLGLGVCVFGLAPLSSQAARFGRDGHVFSTTRVMLGTIVHMTVVHPSKDLAQEAVGRAYEEMQSLSKVFDRHQADTALSVFNEKGMLKAAPQELLQVMDRAARLHVLSGGAFDVTVAPVVDLFKAKSSGGRPLELTNDELAAALSLVDARSIDVSDNTIRMKRQGMGCSLDGIAKGYIVDRASAVLSRHGIHNHLINAGGDIRTRGHNAKGRPWSIAVEDPSGRGDYPAVIRMGDGALATSGGYEIFFDQEKLYHHIISPKTGMSPNTAASVTVRAHSVLEADALSTAVFVMQPQQGISFVNSLPGRECFLVGKDGRNWTSRGWGQLG
ncbi:MAG: FAD:protein FMN transferase [Desulfovibrionales bacterium]